LKTDELILAHTMTDFSQDTVFKAIRMYLDGSFTEILLHRKWSPRTEKPIDKEYFLIGNEYWIQDLEEDVKERREKYYQKKHEGRARAVTSHVCKECGEKTWIYAIEPCKNMRPEQIERSNPNKWKSYYECTNGHVEYRKESIEELIK